MLLIFRDNSVHRNIECTLSNASRRDRNGTIGVCVPFTALPYPFSQSPIIELLTPRDSFESLVANKHFLVGAQIPSLARLKNNVRFFLLTNYVYTTHFPLSFNFLSLTHTHIRARTQIYTQSFSLFSFSFSLCLFLSL